MRVRTLTSLGGALLLTLGLASCGGDEGGSDTASGGGEPTVQATASFAPGTPMAEISEAGQIRVGTKYDQPLFGLQGLGGEPEGFDVEIAKIIAGELGIEPDAIEWTQTPSAVREEVLEQDRVDMVVATYTINDRRRERIDFAGPYYIAGQDIMVAAGNPEAIQGPDDLAGKTVCSVEGSTPAQNIRDNYPEATLVTYDVYSKCADDLANGNVQAVTTDNVILTGLVAGNPEGFELVGNPFTEEPYGIGLALGDTEFRNFINDVLEESYENGAWAAAWDRTAGAITGEEAPEPPAVDRY